MSAPRSASPSKSSRPKGSSNKTADSLAVERRLATPRADLFLIKIGERYTKESTAPQERTSDVLAKVGKVMSKPGTDPKRVFRSSLGRPVYAYSVDPKDTSKVVREDAKGKRTTGRLVGGRFRPVTSTV